MSKPTTTRELLERLIDVTDAVYEMLEHVHFTLDGMGAISEQPSPNPALKQLKMERGLKVAKYLLHDAQTFIDGEEETAKQELETLGGKND